MLFHAVRIVEQFEMSSTVKFVYIRFMGQGVKPTAKGRYGVVSGAVESRFQVCVCVCVRVCVRVCVCVWCVCVQALILSF